MKTATCFRCGYTDRNINATKEHEKWRTVGATFRPGLYDEPLQVGEAVQKTLCSKCASIVEDAYLVVLLGAK